MITTGARGAQTLVVMAKEPRLGRVKTRLAAAIGEQAALAIYEHLLRITGAAARAWRGPVVLAVDGDPDAFAGGGGGDFAAAERVRQPAGGLGPRIATALQEGLARGGAVVVIGSDCPGLTAAALHDVAALLDRHPVAFGPATDGGFWSIATRDPRTAAVIGSAAIPWSSPATLGAARDALAAADLTAALGTVLADCDTHDDLRAAVAAGLL